jgi:hypothetical protein
VENSKRATTICLATSPLWKLQIFSFKMWKTDIFGQYLGIAGGWKGEGGGRGQQGEMAQTMYAHMNKWIKKQLGILTLC